MKSITYLPNLTPLRGIAALLTVIFHIGILIGPFVNLFHVGPMFGPLINHSMLLNRMYLMVDFFFILSGFIMCHVYSNLFADSVTVASFNKFTVARFARVYPLHFITLIYTVFLFSVSARLGIPNIPVLQIENSNYSILTNLFLLHSMNLNNWFSWDHASWSISTEWWAYMIFPFLVKPFVKLNSAGKITIAALCFAGYLCIMFLIVPITSSPAELHFGKGKPSDFSLNVAYQFGFLRCLCGFVFGMIVYQAYQMSWAKRVLANGYTMLLTTTGLFVSMHFALPDALSAAFFPLIILSGAYGSKGINKLFAKKARQQIGEWSFSIYLVHQPLIFTIGNIYTWFHPIDPDHRPAWIPSTHPMLISWIVCIGLIAVVLFVSSLTYRFWELPTRRWINARAVKNPELAKA